MGDQTTHAHEEHAERIAIWRDGAKRIATIIEAAAIMGLDPYDVAWAIEECGQCDTDDAEGRRIIATRKGKRIAPTPVE